MTSATFVRRACVVAGLLLASVPAFAQQTRPVQVLFGVDGVASWVGDGHDLRLSISVPKGDRLSVEFFGGNWHGDPGTLYDTAAIYGFQIRQRIFPGRRPGVDPFLTYGTMGVIGRSVRPDAIVIAGDQRCNGHPCQQSQPATVAPPLLGLFGIGVQHTISPHLALRVEAQGGFFFVIPVGVRVAASVAIPLGRFSSDGAR
jgi:hypothetical protein